MRILRSGIGSVEYSVSGSSTATDYGNSEASDSPVKSRIVEWLYGFFLVVKFGFHKGFAACLEIKKERKFYNLLKWRLLELVQ